MQFNSTFRAEQIGNVFDATHSKRVAHKQVNQKGADENSVCRFPLGYKLSVAKRKRFSAESVANFPQITQKFQSHFELRF